MQCMLIHAHRGHGLPVDSNPTENFNYEVHVEWLTPSRQLMI